MKLIALIALVLSGSVIQARPAHFAPLGVEYHVIADVCMIHGTDCRRIQYSYGSHRGECRLNSKSSAQILLKRDGLQVIRITATPHTAKMIQLKAVWDGTLNGDVGGSMCLPSDTECLKDPISADIHWTSPQPTSAVRLRGNVIHYSLHQCAMIGFSHVIPPVNRIGQAALMLIHRVAISHCTLEAA